MEVVGRVGRDLEPRLVQDFEDFLSCNARLLISADIKRYERHDMTHEAAPSRGQPSSVLRPRVRLLFFPHSTRVDKDTHLLDMLHARRPDQNRVPVLPLHQAVVRHPAQRDLRQRQSGLRSHGLDLVESAEVRLIPVPGPVHLALGRGRIEAGARLAPVLEGAVAAGEEPAAHCRANRR